MNSIQKLKKLAQDLEFESWNAPVEEPLRIIRKEIMVPKTVDICPHCQQEIAEKSLHCANPDVKPFVFTHSCGGQMRSSEEAEQEAEEFLAEFNLDSFNKAIAN